MIYFIRPVGFSGPIKIGKANRPDWRLKAISACSPVPLELAAEADAPDFMENRLHIHFAESLERNEWFSATDELLRLVDEVRKTGRIETEFPHPFDIISGEAEKHGISLELLSDAAKVTLYTIREHSKFRNSMSVEVFLKLRGAVNELKAASAA